ncbi:uncharacterized protein LOC121267186 [Juglans microcarpa x Juglans regia]|uniref:uncharacterized protein LOC121267186 n=1 Tax=Juglans microcarpa x Juglans regia TaxID=2249226 RepID=UPI001B7F39FB|nr:uncharacterized protein LOC121267186 [Juglans microcarpa x Juglans regia]
MKRKVLKEALSPICKRIDESVCHALWSCCGASDVWACERSPVQEWSSCERDMFDFWTEWSSKLAQDQLEIMVVVMRRQALIGKGTGQRYGVQTSRAIRWKPPVGETVKVNWDAAWMADEYRCGIGVVIRDKWGEVLASLCCPRQKCC